MNPPIIGLCGEIGSGKDTVAEYLVEAHGYTFISFAGKLKRVAADVFNLDAAQMSGVNSQAGKAEAIPHVVDASGEPRTVRKILEWLGTEGFRTVDPDVWVKYAMREVDGLTGVGKRWAFPDVRFRNEFEAIRARGGLVWEVVCVGGPDRGTGHRSDLEWRSVPRDNTVAARFGDIEALHRAVDLALVAGPEHQELRR